MRSTLKSARSRIALAAARGTIPASARVSVAAISTFSQARKRCSSLHIRPISARVYRAINAASYADLEKLDCKRRRPGVTSGLDGIMLGQIYIVVRYRRE